MAKEETPKPPTSGVGSTGAAEENATRPETAAPGGAASRDAPAVGRAKKRLAQGDGHKRRRDGDGGKLGAKRSKAGIGGASTSKVKLEKSRLAVYENLLENNAKKNKKVRQEQREKERLTER